MDTFNKAKWLKKITLKITEPDKTQLLKSRYACKYAIQAIEHADFMDYRNIFANFI